MFYLLKNGVSEITADELDSDVLTAGYVDCKTLFELRERLGFAPSTVEACRAANALFRSGVEVYDDYTFTELRIADPDGEDDCVALYMRKNLMLVVDIEDHDGSTKEKFRTAVQRCGVGRASTERLISTFLDALIQNDTMFIEKNGYRLARLEEQVIENQAGKSFNLDLLRLKKTLLHMHNYYDQLLDITEAVEENENEIFDEDNLIGITNVSAKITRLREDVDSLSRTAEHLQDAYTSSLDLQLNHSMKFFTVITTIFFPLTIIVGWYGMNFRYMPEFEWKYGYLYVILLSVAVVALLTWIGKKRKWF
ncbi:MAG: hypothetical protein K6F09_09380 [Clostridiales bacterium]|nr:hypothetical protein [Clostridiales bacterium]